MKLRNTLILVTLTAHASLAHAGRPLATEDAGVLAPHECEWESFVAQPRASGVTATAWASQFACGVTPELQVALSYGQSRASGNTDHALSVNGKWGLLRGQDDGVSVVLAWGAISTRSPGSGAKLTGLFLNGVFTKPLTESWTGHLNLGWTQDRSVSPHAHAMTWNVAAEYAVGNGLELMGEYYGAERSDSFAGVGLRWAASKT